MVNYSCDSCGKEFSQKSHYDSHKRRKKPCKKEINKIELLENKLNVIESKLEKINQKINKPVSNISVKDFYNTIDKRTISPKNKLKDICNELENLTNVTLQEQNDNAEYNTPFDLLYKIINKKSESFWLSLPKIFDHSCGKGHIILTTFDIYYNHLLPVYKDPVKLCLKIINECLYFADINENNIIRTKQLLTEHSKLYTHTDTNYLFNTYCGDSKKIICKKDFNINYFDALIVNPPFQDSNKRNTTQHKLWIDFTKLTFDKWLKPGGTLMQISPSSFSSPSSKILTIFKTKTVEHLYLHEEKYFKNINSSICWYIIKNIDNDTNITNINDTHKLMFNKTMLYLPNDFCNESISIHKKVMFDSVDKLTVLHDYVTAHNILRKKENPTLSKEKTDTHIYPVFHTNRQTWYSSIKQSFLEKTKVMWTRSGYTKPFYDDGTQGVTDLAYYVLVNTKQSGLILEHNLNLKLFKYILKTARWSGFGNDKVFYALPKLPEKKYTDEELYTYFDLTQEEVTYIENYL